MKYGRLLLACGATVASSPLDPATAVTPTSTVCMNVIQQEQPQISKAQQDMQAAQSSGNQAAICSAMHELDPVMTAIAANCSAADLPSSTGNMLSQWASAEAAMCKPGAVMLTPRRPLMPPGTRGVPLRH